MNYPGAEIMNVDGAWWIIHDNGKTGPFSSYDLASNEANLSDDNIPMEGNM
jgi:hypothetical protein